MVVFALALARELELGKAPGLESRGVLAVVCAKADVNARVGRGLDLHRREEHAGEAADHSELLCHSCRPLARRAQEEIRPYCVYQCNKVESV